MGGGGGSLERERERENNDGGDIGVQRRKQDSDGQWEVREVHA